MRNLVVGQGEVGKALLEVLRLGYPDTTGIDIGGEIPQADWVHIAFPWSSDFLEEVGRYQQETGGTIIVHSTVPVGTCDPNGWVHSPVRGRHPDLAQSLLLFVKFVGCEDEKLATRVAYLLRTCGISVEVLPDAKTTEAGKLWELAQFGVAVLLEKQIARFCEDHAIPRAIVYERFAQTYNEGYASMGEGRFVRPVLDHEEGPIGGHCIIPSMDLLNDRVADWVWDWDREFWQE